MAQYKVLQDIEAEDKIVGPLTLWQFVYALVALGCVYLSFIAVMRNLSALLVFTVPVALFTGFLAFPWGGDQPTEVWALAKIRYHFKPRKRFWSQSGQEELVTITAPKSPKRDLTDGLSQHEVRSRLSALATTLDSRGWAVKNVNINMINPAMLQNRYESSDRLVDVSSNIPEQEVSALDIRPSDDILDETNNPIAQAFNTMLIEGAASEYRQAVSDRNVGATNQPNEAASYQQYGSNLSTLSGQQFGTNHSFTPQPLNAEPPAPYLLGSGSNDYPQEEAFVTDGVPQAAEPNADELALLDELKDKQSSMAVSYDHLKTVKTPDQLAEEEAEIASAQAKRAQEAREALMTSERKAAIMNLNKRENLKSTLAKGSEDDSDPDEVVITLH